MNNGNEIGKYEELQGQIDALIHSADFSAYAPKSCDVESFNNFTLGIVQNYQSRKEHRPQGAVERDLKKLRDLLSKMNADVRAEIISRECLGLKEDQLEDFKDIILRGGSALGKLERLVEKPFTRSTRRDYTDRRNMFNFAIANFVSSGGKLSSKLDSDLMHYLDAIAYAAGVDPFDAQKAVQKYRET